MKGTYCLIIENRKNIEIKVGAIGQVPFKAGFYIYIGSAMNSLIPRINRHLSNKKKIYWHIDYLLNNPNTQIKEVLFTNSEQRIECELARKISKKQTTVENFGSSDCNCSSHLIYFKNYDEGLNIVKNTYENLNINYYNLNYFKTLK